MMNWTEQQERIFDFVANGTGNAVVEAYAGTGKTTTIVEAVNRVPRGKRVLFVAFNKVIAEELKRRLPAGADAMTLHSLGLKAVTRACGRRPIDGDAHHRHTGYRNSETPAPGVTLAPAVVAPAAVGTGVASSTGMTTPKLTTFEIATAGKCDAHTTGRNGVGYCPDCYKAKPGRAERKGYVLGGWATHKEPGPGNYFWTFTHIGTGMSVNVWPCHETKATALAHLAKLADGTAPQVATTEAMLAKHGRGWGAT